MPPSRLVMGNAVIAGILFQTPSPPNFLDYLGPDDDNNNYNASNGDEQVARGRSHNILVEYLWLYSRDGRGRWTLIPAIHITHNGSAVTGRNAAGS